MKNFRQSSLILLTLALILLVITCNKEEVPTEIPEKETPPLTKNHGPVITHLFVDADSVFIGQEVDLVCFAKDEDNDPLTFTWSCKRGILINWTGGSKKYRAENFWGKDTVFVVVSDGKDVYTGKIIIYVTPYPSKPSLAYPQWNQSNITIPPVLTWSAYNADSYTLQIYKDYYMNSFIYNESGIKEKSKKIDGLEIATVYNWRVKAKNSYGESVWSYTYPFITVAPPYAPSLNMPVNNSINIGLFPILRWNVNTYTDSYCLQISTRNDFSDLIYNKCGLISTSEQISSLQDGTTYYWRVDAKNEYGVSPFSDVNTFKTGTNFNDGGACEGVVYVNYAGKVYNTVKIGKQCWLKENLDVGTMIPSGQNASNNGTIEKYCSDSKQENCDAFGGIYQWDEAMEYSAKPGSKGICPTGFHIPTKEEFETLKAYVNENGDALKAQGYGGSNTSGFNALILGGYNNFWSSTEDGNPDGYFMTLGKSGSYIAIGYGISKNSGFYIRCMKD